MTEPTVSIKVLRIDTEAVPETWLEVVPIGVRTISPDSNMRNALEVWMRATKRILPYTAPEFPVRQISYCIPRIEKGQIVDGPTKVIEILTPRAELTSAELEDERRRLFSQLPEEFHVFFNRMCNRIDRHIEEEYHFLREMYNEFAPAWKAFQTRLLRHPSVNA